MHEKILFFLKKEYILTLATSINNIPWCANCFYTFLEKNNSFIFKSDKSTRHIKEGILNNSVAGTILPTLIKEKEIIGLQLTGKFFIPENDILKIAKNEYYEKFPYARLVGGNFWGIKLLTLKYTDHRLGFGKKLYWESQN